MFSAGVPNLGPGCLPVRNSGSSENDESDDAVRATATAFYREWAYVGAFSTRLDFWASETRMELRTMRCLPQLTGGVLIPHHTGAVGTEPLGC